MLIAKNIETGQSKSANRKVSLFVEFFSVKRAAFFQSKLIQLFFLEPARVQSLRFLVFAQNVLNVQVQEVLTLCPLSHTNTYLAYSLVSSDILSASIGLIILIKET